MTRFLVVTWLFASAAAASAQPAPVARPSAPVPTASAPDRESRVFELRTYYAPEGKVEALHARFRNYALPLFEKHGMTNVGYWAPADGAPGRVVFLLAYPSRAARDQSWAALVADPAWQRVKNLTEARGKLVEKIDELFLTPTEYTPAVAAAAADGPRVFELRVCTARDGNLDRLHAQCKASIRAMAKDGVETIGYWTPAEGQKGAGVTVVSLVARRVDRFGELAANPVLRDPGLIGAQGVELKPVALPGGSDEFQVQLLKPTDYSPLK